MPPFATSPFLQRNVETLQDYLEDFNYRGMADIFLANRAAPGTGNYNWYSPLYASRVRDRSDMMGAIYNILTGVTPNAFDPRGALEAPEEFQEVFQSFFRPVTGAQPTMRDYRDQTLRALFSPAARQYEETVAGQTGGGRNTFERLMNEVRTMLMGNYSPTALDALFGNAAQNRLYNQYADRQSRGATAQSVLEFLREVYGNFIPQAALR